MRAKAVGYVVVTNRGAAGSVHRVRACRDDMWLYHGRRRLRSRLRTGSAAVALRVAYHRDHRSLGHLDSRDDADGRSASKRCVALVRYVKESFALS